MKALNRKFSFFSVFSVLCLLMLLCACGRKSSEMIEKSNTPARVAALSRSIAELWLLAGGSPVGVTEDALSLDDISEETAVIGTISKPNAEAIIALEPDLVLLASDIPSQAALKTQLEGLNISCEEVIVDSFSDYAAVMKHFTELTGRDDLYQKNVKDVEERIQSILAEYDVPEVKATFLTLRVSSAKNKVLKDDYFGNEIFTNLGLSNIVSDTKSWDELNIEAIIEADPDYIFIVLQGDSEKAAESYKREFESSASWQDLKAVKNGNLFFLPKEYFQYKPNAKWDKAYEYALEILTR